MTEREENICEKCEAEEGDVVYGPYYRGTQLELLSDYEYLCDDCWKQECKKALDDAKQRAKNRKLLTGSARGWDQGYDWYQG